MENSPTDSPEKPYSRFTRRLAEAPVTPPLLLALVVAAAGLLSSLLCNDIICLAMAPVLAQACAHRGLNPVPFLLALVCAANVGSAATLIGNPQNMLIGQVLELDFGRYLLQALPPTLIGLAVVWAVICVLTRGNWLRSVASQPAAGAGDPVWAERRSVEPGHAARRRRMAVLAGVVFRGQGTGFRAQGSGFRVQGSGDRGQGTGDRGQGAGDRGQRAEGRGLARRELTIL